MHVNYKTLILQQIVSSFDLIRKEKQQQLKAAKAQKQQQQQQLGVDFTPNFNSWTNFSFTKNFIANVFC